MSFLNFGETHLVLLLVSFSVFILWSTTWAIIERRKIIIFIPFLIIGFTTCLYAGLIFYSRIPSIYILKAVYLLADLLLFILVLRRVVWKNH